MNQPNQPETPSAPAEKSALESCQGRTIWNSDGTDGPCLICAPPTPKEEAEANRLRAQAIEESAAAVSDSSEYPRLALMACREQAAALRNLADVQESVGTIRPKRDEMTGEERRERRADILRLRAAKQRVEASNHLRASHDIGCRIPFGQPILVGHHSEKGHRRAIDRMHSHDAKGYGALQYAETLERRADNVERRPSIQASDSDAVEQYRGKLEMLTRERDNMKATNAAWRSYQRTKDQSELNALGFSAGDVLALETKIASAYSWERQPYPHWQLTNLGARIRDITKKLERLEQDKAAADVVRECANDIRLEDSPSANRVRLFFPGKPDAITRTELKRNGYRWTPSLGCWQAYRNWRAMELAKKFTTPPTEACECGAEQVKHELPSGESVNVCANTIEKFQLLNLTQQDNENKSLPSTTN